MMSAQLARATQLREEARLSMELGNIDRAEVLFLESMEIFMQAERVLLDAFDHARRVFGENDEQTASIRDQLARLNEQRGKPEKAETL